MAWASSSYSSLTPNPNHQSNEPIPTIQSSPKLNPPSPSAPSCSSSPSSSSPSPLSSLPSLPPLPFPFPRVASSPNAAALPPDSTATGSPGVGRRQRTAPETLILLCKAWVGFTGAGPDPCRSF
ncbi:hypothetical protein LINGRAHAP2_LOCUS24990 [Linum grandiflorum]